MYYINALLLHLSLTKKLALLVDLKTIRW